MSELWENPLYSVEERLEMAVGGIAFRDKIVAQLRAKLEPKEKIAPVQGYSPGIPWSLHLEAYEVYCKKYGKQDAMIDLEGKNCRGGFHVGELDEFIPGWRDRVSEITKLKARVAELEAQIAAAKTTPPSDAEINSVTMDKLGMWPSFEAQSWACKVVHAVLETHRLELSAVPTAYWWNDLARGGRVVKAVGFEAPVFIATDHLHPLYEPMPTKEST